MINIQISGPGGTFRYELAIIEKALKEAGCTVEIEDIFPDDDKEETIKVIRERLDSGYIKDKLVKITTNHIPWGG